MILKTQEEIDKELNEIIESLSPNDVQEINFFFERCDLKLKEEKNKPDYKKPNWSVDEMFQWCINTLEELSC